MDELVTGQSQFLEGRKKQVSSVSSVYAFILNFHENLWIVTKLAFYVTHIPAIPLTDVFYDP